MTSRAPLVQAPSSDELDAFLNTLFERFCYDFRGYARASLVRRIKHGLRAYGFERLEELRHHLLRQPEEFPALLQYLTVQVSELFRDPEYYRVLRTELIPVLATYPSPKIWVAGCATGEEAYSFAIVLREEGLLERSVIYATDINVAGLNQAQQGVRRLDGMAEATERHRASGASCSLSEHYTAGYGSVIFDRRLRQRLVFSEHSLTTDEVFSEVQLVSCRNVLIYFDRPAQERALGLFKEALCRRGFIGLGARETLKFSDVGAGFSEFASAERWYQKR